MRIRINKRFVAKSAIYALIFIFFVALETNALNSLKVFGAKPNLVILLVLAGAVTETEKYAAVLGMVCGFIVDSSVGSPFFFSGAYYFVAAYISGAVTRYYFTKSLLTMVILTLPACAVRGVINLFSIMGVWGNFNLGEALLAYILPEYIYTVALGPAVYFLVKFTAGRISYSSI